jgi:glycosyltransferase involved in cell wall biosynthesis
MGARDAAASVNERIALLSSAASIHSRRWAAALAEREFTVRLLSLEAAPPEWMPPPGVTLRRLPSWPLPMAIRYPLALPALVRELADFEPHLVDAHFVPSYGLLSALCGRRPRVVNAWGSDLLLGRDPLRVVRARFALAGADRVIVDAANLGARALALGVDAARLLVQPWGIELEHFAYRGDGAARRAARAGWPPAWSAGGAEGPAVVSTRMLHPIYDVATLVRAWPRVRAAALGARLWIAGEGPERAALEALAARTDPGNSIRFLGRLAHTDLPRLLAGADVYVSTSRSDSTSLSLLEAMGAGAFPVVTDIEGNREWVGEDCAGLFARGDDAALADRMVEALLDPRERVGARLRNRATVEMRGDWRRTVDRIAALHRALIAERVRR